MILNSLIRQAQISDIDQIMTITQEVQSMHIGFFPSIFKDFDLIQLRDWINAQLARSDTKIFVAEFDSIVVACLILKFIDKAGNVFAHPQKFTNIEHVCVSSIHRRQGIGKKIIQYAMNHSRENGYNRIDLEVWTPNETAKLVYTNIGFKQKSEKLSCNL